MATLDRNNDLLGKKKRSAMLRFILPPQEKDETEIRWLMSYSDFMMQLVCLFILLYSVSSIDTSKAVPLAQAWRDEVGIGEVKVPSAPKTLNAPLTFADVPAVIHEIQILAGRHPGGGALRVFRNSEGFRLWFAYEMFDRGSDRLGKQGTQVADLAAQLFQAVANRGVTFEIVGHASADEEGGLALSLHRAREALRWMTRPELPHRIEPGLLQAAGRGPHEPAADNAGASGRALNRRVEFVVRLGARP
jgi:flagellar motor protein MotB